MVIIRISKELQFLTTERSFYILRVLHDITENGGNLFDYNLGTYLVYTSFYRLKLPCPGQNSCTLRLHIFSSVSKTCKCFLKLHLFL